MKYRLSVERDGKPDNVLLEWQLALTLNGMSGRYGLTCQEVLPLCVGMPFGPPPAAKTEGDPPTDKDAPDWEAQQDAWMMSAFPKAPESYRSLPKQPKEARDAAWDQATQLYRTSALRLLLGPAGEDEARRGSSVEGFKSLHEQLVVPDGTKAPVAMEPDPLWRDEDRGFFPKRAAAQHNKIFAEMFGGTDDLDQALASDSSRLTPAAVLQHLFECKTVYHAHELADRQRFLEANDEPVDVSEGGQHEQGDADAAVADTAVDDALSKAKDGVLTAPAVSRTLTGGSLPDDTLDVLAVQFADAIHRAVEERCRQNLSMGLGGDAKALEALPEHFTFDELLGGTIMRCGRTKSTQETAEELQQDGNVVVLFFGCSREPASAKFARKLRAVHDRLMRVGGKYSDKPLEIVYVPTGETQMEFDRFTLREAGGWWAIPYEASSLLGQRAARRFGVQGVPHAVVLQWNAEKGHCTVVNADAEHEIATDSKGENYPWPVQSIDEMLGKVLLNHEMAKFKRQDVITSKCKVLALYFGGEWCPHCISFKPTVLKAYKSLKGKFGDEFEMVYISSDQDQTAYDRYFGSMEWYAPHVPSIGHVARPPHPAPW